MPKAKEQNKNLQNRPPVVVVLGHVDHGKSSILEAIKDLKITAKESGGITQHIGAYEVEHQGKKITFIDTPGHEAFSQIRSRGSKAADIAILVVAGDEGVKEQTKEAIAHIKEAQIPVIVAINKIDKPNVNFEKVKGELAKNDILTESMGGKVPSVELSAKTKKGIPELLELILLVADLENLKADSEKPGQGVIIESYMDSNRGPVTTLLVEDGAFKRGDILATISALGKVKNLEDFQGKSVEKALPSMPVVVLGFEKVPGVGEEVKVFFDIESANNFSTEKNKKSAGPLEAPPDKKVLNIILKADVLGSLEAIENILKALPQEKIVLRILKSEVGEINESDVNLAKTSGAKILGFRVKANQTAVDFAEREEIRILIFDIIYELVQATRQYLEKIIGPEIIKKTVGRMKVLAIFRTDKNRQVVGGKVVDGEIKRGASAEIYRNDEKIGKGKIVGLQKDKKDADAVSKGAECGILYEGNIKIEEKDILETYIEERQKGEL